MNNDKKFLDKSFEDLLKDPNLNKKDLALDKQDKSAVIYLKVSKIKRNPFQTEKIYSESKIDLLAKSIKEKYIDVPQTTDFAVMFLPIEGLYAEVVRDIELMETLQNQFKVIVCGPTTLAALLNSLQLGFKTLHIQKRSSELWQVLSTFKQEFEKFVQLLLKTQNKLGEANSTIELATKSSRKIAKKLGDVSQIVGIDYDDDDDDMDALPPIED